MRAVLTFVLSIVHFGNGINILPYWKGRDPYLSPKRSKDPNQIEWSSYYGDVAQSLARLARLKGAGRVDEEIRRAGTCVNIRRKEFLEHNEADMRRRVSDRMKRSKSRFDVRENESPNPLKIMHLVCSSSEIADSIELIWTSLYHRLCNNALWVRGWRHSPSRNIKELLNEYESPHESAEWRLRFLLAALRRLAQDEVKGESGTLVKALVSPDSTEFMQMLAPLLPDWKEFTSVSPDRPIKKYHGITPELAMNEDMLTAIATEDPAVLVEGLPLCEGCTSNTPKWLGSILRGLVAAEFFSLDKNTKTYSMNPQRGSDLQWIGVGRVIALSLIEGVPLGIEFEQKFYPIFLKEACSKESSAVKMMRTGFHNLISVKAICPSTSENSESTCSLTPNNLEKMLLGIKITGQFVLRRLEYKGLSAYSKQRQWIEGLLFSETVYPDLPSQLLFFFTGMRTVPISGFSGNLRISGSRFANSFTSKSSSSSGERTLIIPTSFKNKTTFQTQLLAFLEKVVGDEWMVIIPPPGPNNSRSCN